MRKVTEERQVDLVDLLVALLTQPDAVAELPVVLAKPGVELAKVQVAAFVMAQSSETPPAFSAKRTRRVRVQCHARGRARMRSLPVERSP